MTDLQQLKLNAQAWAEDAKSRGLIDNKTLEQLHEFNARTPASLFTAEERPLVVGFFGGTGVGKSTLLNRLAQENIARTGVERPTSREVTMYLHSTVHVEHLPAEYPTHQIKTAFHNNEANRYILWIDMPDFDSAETANRKLVNDWLPHIDMLVYVVSPERYRDDNGWRLLLQHSGKHAWVFVINHWDKGNPAQIKDFETLLVEAGLEQPYLFCTDSSSEPEQDEFNSLRDLIQSMASAKTVAQLEQRGTLARIDEMRTIIKESTSRMGTDQDYAEIKSQWDSFWNLESAGILNGVNWKYPLLTQHYESKEPGLFGALLNKIREIVQMVAHKDLPALAVRASLNPITNQLGERINNRVEQSRDAALANPGSTLQRASAQFCTILSTLLPILALIWVGYRIVFSFYLGGSNPAQYLGSNFAINALLLIGLSWILPFLLARKLTPSLPRVAAKGMRHGAELALGELQQEVHNAIDQVSADKQQLSNTGEALFHEVPISKQTPISDKLGRALT